MSTTVRSRVSVCRAVRCKTEFFASKISVSKDHTRLLVDFGYAMRFHVCHQSNCTKSHLIHVALGQWHSLGFSSSHSVKIP